MTMPGEWENSNHDGRKNSQQDKNEGGNNRQDESPEMEVTTPQPSQARLAT